jgi:hypothetical protein
VWWPASEKNWHCGTYRCGGGEARPGGAGGVAQTGNDGAGGVAQTGSDNAVGVARSDMGLVGSGTGGGGFGPGKRARRGGRWRDREAAAVGTDAHGPDSALRHGAARSRGSHAAMVR